MLLVFGLGNPGKEYEHTRHNVGFDIVDILAQKEGLRFSRLDRHGLMAEGGFGRQKLILVKPQTYMNLSGECVSEVLSFYKPESEEVLIVYDDIDLALGKIRMRKKGSAGTHNGMRSVLSLCGREDLPRLRVGIGKKPDGWDLADWVLSHYATEEDRRIQYEAFCYAAGAIQTMRTSGLDAAMQVANAKREEEEHS